ncbi:hypothetical protein [Nonomuraea basaltis]|uniref:hypothetical protein n=1 Tax=Nonomuraea basaltis TaxID=2495887 RepID=UPI00110C509E|nr:hypothetical protein [Nonomuraea basaltis]TMR94726.1 hypothetical protein EJK15_32430 [Nonomuraea basaltis]
MRKTLALATLAGSMAVTGLALTPAAQAATQTATAATQSTTTTVKWGKFFSSDGKAYTYGKTWKQGGKVYTKWYGVDKVGGKKAWVWFEFYQNGSWHKFNKSWDGKVVGAWSGRGIKKVYTFTCWEGKFDNCGRKYRIY